MPLFAMVECLSCSHELTFDKRVYFVPQLSFALGVLTYSVERARSNDWRRFLGASPARPPPFRTIKNES